MNDVAFRRDLYRGTASYYDRFRVPYPAALIDDLARRADADGSGTLLDLACGTGQLSFALADRFGAVWAVDQEPDMVDLLTEKARAAGIGHIRAVTAAAEVLSVPAASFDLVAIGNAFHRLPRDVVAGRVLLWLRPGGLLALVWGGSPWDGHAQWQQVLRAVMNHWQALAGAAARVPQGYEAARRDRPDIVVLREAGFEIVGRFEFTADWGWTPQTLAGHAFSTSVLSRDALGDLAAAFEADLLRELAVCEPSGRIRQPISFGYDLARRPPA